MKKDTAGEREIMITCKGKTASLKVPVKERTLTGPEITK